MDPAAPSEIIRVTNVSGTTWTVTRGVEGTIPVAHTSGFTVNNVVTKGWLDSVEDRGVFNVKKYGATGDGTTDDTTAIQSTITAAGAGGVILFPPGTYEVTSALTLPVLATGALVVRGAGITATTLNYTGTGYLWNIGDGGVTNAQYTYIEDMMMVGSATNPAGCIKFNHTRFCGVRSCYIKDFTKAEARGIDIVTSQHNYFGLIDQCRIFNVPTGIYMESDPTSGIGANSNHIRQCHFGGHSSYAIHIVGGDTNTVEYCEFNGSITTAVRLEGVARNNKFLNNQYDGPATSIQIASSSVEGTVVVGDSAGTMSDSGAGTLVFGASSGAATIYGKNGIIIGGTSGDPASIPLRVRGAASQSTDTFKVENSDGSTTLMHVDQSGNLYIRYSGFFHAHTIFKADAGGNSIVATVDGQGAANGATILRILQRSTGTTGDMQRWADSAGTTIYSRINKDGYFGTTKTSAPADADVSTSEALLYWDNTSGNPKLKAKGKDSAGTATTHTLSAFQQITFHVSGALSTGVKLPEFLTPVAMTIIDMKGRCNSGSNATYRPSKNGGTTDGSVSAETGTTVVSTSQSLSLAAGDRLALNVTAAGTGSDLSVTFWARLS